MNVPSAGEEVYRSETRQVLESVLVLKSTGCGNSKWVSFHHDHHVSFLVLPWAEWMWPMRLQLVQMDKLHMIRSSMLAIVSMSIWCFGTVGTVRFDLHSTVRCPMKAHESPSYWDLVPINCRRSTKSIQILHTKTWAKPSLESEPCLDAPGRLFIVEAKAVSWSRFGHEGHSIWDLFYGSRMLQGFEANLNPKLCKKHQEAHRGWNLQQTESGVSKLVLHRSPLKGSTLVSCAFKQQLVPQLNNMLSWNKTGSQCLAMLKRFQKWVLRALHAVRCETWVQI